MPISTDVWSLIQQNPLCVYVNFHVLSLLIHIKQLFKHMVIEYSSPHKDLASILLCYHKEKCLILSVKKTSSFSWPKYKWSKRSRLSLRSLHTFENFGYYYYYDCVTFKTSSWYFLNSSLTYYHKGDFVNGDFAKTCDKSQTSKTSERLHRHCRMSSLALEAVSLC